MTRELIEDFTKIVKPFVQKRLLEENFEGMGEQDKAEFGRDFDEILSLAIKGLESSTWIPVTERLPDNSGRYLVNYSSGYVSTALYYESVLKWGCTTTERIVAWQPLPEPYKTESEGKE